jgi:release factor glutamine methyltransferase
VARACVGVIGRHLAPDGCALLQLGSTRQVEGLRDDLAVAGLRVAETRTFGERGVVALLSR